MLRAILFLALVALVNAARLTVSLQPSPQLPNPATLPSSTHAVLLGPAGTTYDVPLRRNSQFIFPDLQAASYLLTIYCRDYFFPPLRIDVAKPSEAEGEGAGGETISAWQTFRGNEWSNKGPSYGSGTGELNVQVAAMGGKDYYQPRGGFSVLSFLKSPMILMGLVSVVFIFGLPYIMENMDPETRAEFEEIQKSGPMGGGQGNMANQLQNFDMASWMAGKGQGGGASGGGSKRK